MTGKGIEFTSVDNAIEGVESDRARNRLSAGLRTLLLGGASLALIAAVGLPAGSAWAQDADEDEEAAGNPRDDVDTLVVTGFRRSIESAIENKRNAGSVIESITAEDIGRLPDISIAESLARLPGITSQRTSGQSSAINIRGLSQQLTLSLLNGRELVTPNGNRSVEFEQFPSELLVGADVYKSAEAGLLAGGLAGTVDLKTVRPLDRNGPQTTFNIRGSFNDRADEIFDANDFGYRLSGTYINQFANDTIGFSIGYARLVQPNVSTRFVGFDYDNFAPNDFNGDGVNDVVSFGFEVEEEGGRDVRDGVISTIEWRPTENFSWTTDGYYSRFDSEGFGRGIRVIGPQAVNFGNPNTTVTDPLVINNALVGGTLARNVGAPTVDGGGFGLTAQGINDNQADEDEFIAVGSRLEWENQRVRTAFDFTYSRAESAFANEVSAILPLTSLDGGVPGVSNDSPNTAVLNDDLSIFFQLNGTDIATVDFSQDFTDLDGLFLSRFGAFPFENDDELFAYVGEFEYFFDEPFLESFEFGIRYAERDAEQFRESFDAGNDAGFFQFSPNAFTPIALNSSNTSIECFSGDFAANGFPCFPVVADPRALFESGSGINVVPDQSQTFTQTESFSISEQTISGWFQANLDTEVFGIPMRGNVGVRVVRTEQESVTQLPGIPSGLTYTLPLPAVNFIFDVTDRDIIRLSGSRAIARPGLFQLGAGFNVSFDENTNELGGGGQGNPQLEPFLSNNGDISYEHYFDNGGIVTVAAFYKALQTFIVNDTDPNFDFSEIVQFLSAEDALQLQAALASGEADLTGNFGGPVNGEGGFIWGLEFAYTQAFDFLPAPFDGLGMTINYAYTQSEIDFDATNSGALLTLPLPGLSENVFNGTFFYEKGPFSNRVGLRFRDQFVSPQIGINQQLPFTDNELVVDYQASYVLEGLFGTNDVTLLFQANNLTDEPVATFFGSEAQTGTVQFFGRQFFFGASTTF